MIPDCVKTAIHGLNTKNWKKITEMQRIKVLTVIALVLMLTFTALMTKGTKC